MLRSMQMNVSKIVFHGLAAATIVHLPVAANAGQWSCTDRSLRQALCRDGTCEFKTNFTPMAVSWDEQTNNFSIGYYESFLRGTAVETKIDPYSVLISVDLKARTEGTASSQQPGKAVLVLNRESGYGQLSWSGVYSILRCTTSQK